MELQLLGSPVITEDGLRVTDFVSDKVVALFGYLAMNRGPQARQTMAGLLWSEMPEKRARANLRLALHNLRQLFPGYLDVTRKQVAFVHEQPHWMDVTAFEESARRTGDVEALKRAAELYRDELLKGLVVDGAQVFESWLRGERERLHLKLLQVLECLAKRFSEQGRWANAEETMRRLLALVPWNERVHRQLMVLLARQGEYAAALAQYERCRELLEIELGVEPMQETKALQRRIRRLRTGPRHNLPAQTTTILGRQKELEQVTALLLDDEVRLVTIAGLGGVGKTRLAAEAAGRQVGTFLDGVFWVSLAGLNDANYLSAAISKVLGIDSRQDGESQSRLLEFLQHRELLLVLDNFEHLLPEVSLLNAVLARAPSVKMLVTSRESLGMPAEHLLSLTGLTLSRSISADKWKPVGAVALYLARVRQLIPAYSPGEHERKAIVRICELVEGLPLGLELAAAWADALSPQRIAGEIEENLAFLQRSAARPPARHDSIQACLATSWQRLQPAEQDLLAALSVFRGGFSRESAHQVAGVDALVLARFVRKSLVRYKSAERRYHMHELLRQFGTMMLAESPGRERDVRRGHSTYFCGQMARWGEMMKGEEQVEALNAIEEEIDNVRSAWEWAVESRRVADIGRSMDALCRFYSWKGQPRLAAGACRLAAESLIGDRISLSGEPSSSLTVVARLLTWEGLFLDRLGHEEQGLRRQRLALSLLSEAATAGEDTRAARAFTLWKMSWIILDSVEGVALLMESLALYRELGRQWEVAEVLASLANRHWFLSNYEAAKESMEKSRTIRRRLHDQIGLADAYSLLRRIPLYQGNTEEAERLAREELALRRDLGDRRTEAQILGSLGVGCWLRGEFVEALGLFDKSITIYETLVVPRSLVNYQGMRSHALLHLGQYDRALEVAEQALVDAEELLERHTISRAYLLFGSVAMVEEQLPEAADWFQKALEIYRETEHPPELAWALALAGMAQCALGETADGQRLLSEALAIVQEKEIGDVPLIMGLVGVAYLYLFEGNTKRAVELYTLACQHPHVSSSIWMESVVGGPIATAAVQLSAEIVASTQLGGDGRDLRQVAGDVLKTLKSGEL